MIAWYWLSSSDSMACISRSFANGLLEQRRERWSKSSRRGPPSGINKSFSFALFRVTGTRKCDSHSPQRVQHHHFAVIWLVCSRQNSYFRLEFESHTERSKMWLLREVVSSNHVRTSRRTTSTSTQSITLILTSKVVMMHSFELRPSQ